MTKDEKMKEIWESYLNGNVSWAVDEYIVNKMDTNDMDEFPL